MPSFVAILVFFLLDVVASMLLLRLSSFTEICAAATGASLSDVDVGGVLAPDGGMDESVAELSSMVPAMASPLTKKP